MYIWLQNRAARHCGTPGDALFIRCTAVGQNAGRTRAPALDTEITYWYAEKEAKARKEDMDFLKGYLSNVTFVEIPGYEHGELVMVYPDDFYRIFTATIGSFTSAQNA